jgi:hypothetical protein
MDLFTAKLLKLSLETLRDNLRVPLEIGSCIDDSKLRKLLGVLGSEIMGSVEFQLIPRILELYPELADDRANQVDI